MSNQDTIVDDAPEAATPSGTEVPPVAEPTDASVVDPPEAPKPAKAAKAPKPATTRKASSTPAKVPVFSYDFTGDVRPDGQPAVHLGGYDIPPRLLTREEFQALTPAQKRAIKAHPELYEPIGERAYTGRSKKYAEAMAAGDGPESARLIDPAFRTSGTVDVTDPSGEGDGEDTPDPDVDDTE